MGAEQSSHRSPQDLRAEATPTKTCYYEVLGVERTATDIEIKKAYRKKALELHPDRNFGDVEAATSKFAEVQAAHEVLSDPQERAWYDSHRADILGGGDGTSGRSKGDHQDNYAHLTSTRDIVNLISRFGPGVRFTDAADGFYGILQSTFAKLADEEYEACDYMDLERPDLPDFGKSTDDYEDVVRPFYRAWTGFSTKKSFSWRDEYRTTDAEHRTMRRAIEKENKKLRDEGIRDFNDAVRALVTFVRRRDPRYLPNSQTDADRQKTLREAAAAQAARSRAANQAKLSEHVVPEWTISSRAPEEATFSDSDELEVEHIECVACGKIFKSEKQYQTHERSKKHIKTVQQLKREMHRENRRLGLDIDITTSPSQTIGPLSTSSSEPDKDSNGLSEVSEDTVKENEEDEENLVSLDTSPTELSKDSLDYSDVDEEYAPRAEVETRLNESFSRANSQTNMEEADSTISEVESGPPKLGKAKLKKAKKAAKQVASTSDNLEVECAACKANFTSKNKLFDHIKAFPGHAQPPKARGKKSR